MLRKGVTFVFSDRIPGQKVTLGRKGLSQPKFPGDTVRHAAFGEQFDICNLCLSKNSFILRMSSRRHGKVVCSIPTDKGKLVLT